MPTLAVKAVLMKGLTCGYTTACESGTSITAGKFTLFCYMPYRPPPRPAEGSGGSRPMQPGEISQLYQPVPQPQQYYLVPREEEARYMRTRVPVTILFKMGERSLEKEYMVPEERARIVANVINVVNVTKERMSVTVKNIKRLYCKVKVKVTNFRHER